jgi:transcriptional regulator with XRE-family HTH domain
MMSKENGRWLRAQRQARAWNVPKMAHELRAVADATGDNVPTVATMEAHVRRWERGVINPSERYLLYYCKAFGIRADQYGPGNDAAPPPGAPEPAAAATSVPSAHLLPAQGAGIAAWPLRPGWLASGDATDRWVQEPDLGGTGIRREILTAAHESSGQAERAERRDIGEVTLEQVRADVERVSREYMTGQPLVLFFEMRRVRDRMHAALERRLWPRDTTDLHFLLGCVNCLMATAAKVLRYPSAASELERAGQVYAAGIGNRPLMARLRLASAQAAYLYGRPRQAADLASGAVQCLSAGPNAASFHLVHAQAAARLGDVDTARAAIAAAGEAREGEYRDDLLAIGGEFGFCQASQHFFAGAALVQIPGAEADAIDELERAIKMYADGPGPGEDHSDQCRVAAHIDLAAARLRAGRLDAAIAAIEPVMAVPPGLRTEVVSQRLAVVRAELTQPIYRSSPQAKETGERIGEFCRDTIVAELHDLPDGPA